MRTIISNYLKNTFTGSRDQHATTVSWVIIIISVSAVAGLHLALDFTQAPIYFLAHFWFGLSFPFVLYLILGTPGGFYLGLFLGAVWHYGNEFWEDQLTRPVFSLDVDHLISGTIGLAVAMFFFKASQRLKP